MVFAVSRQLGENPYTGGPTYATLMWYSHYARTVFYLSFRSEAEKSAFLPIPLPKKSRSLRDDKKEAIYTRINFPLSSLNRSPRHSIVSSSNPKSQSNRQATSLKGTSHRSRNTCPSRSTPTPTARQTVMRASSAIESNEKLQRSNPLAMTVAKAQGTQ